MTTQNVILLVLLILAFVLAGLAGVGVAHPRLHFGWIAIALIVLVGIIERVAT